MKIIISQIIEEVKTFKEKCQVNQVTEAECPIHPYSLFSRHKRRCLVRLGLVRLSAWHLFYSSGKQVARATLQKKFGPGAESTVEIWSVHENLVIYK